MLRIVVVILGFAAAAIIGKIVQVYFMQVGWYVIGISIGVAVIWSIAYVFRSFRFTRRFNQMALSDLQDKAPNFREHDTVGLDTILTFGLEAEKWLETLLKRTFKESQEFPADYSLLVTQYIRYLESLKHYLGIVIDRGPATAIDLDGDGETFWLDMRGKAYNYEELVTQLNWLHGISEEHSKITRDFQTPMSLPSWTRDSLLVAKKYSKEEVMHDERLNYYFGDHEVISVKCTTSKIQAQIDQLARFVDCDD